MVEIDRSKLSVEERSALYFSVVERISKIEGLLNGMFNSPSINENLEFLKKSYMDEYKTLNRLKSILFE
jgi:hypothetical protein